jgi:putrescine aminotransferase
MVDTNEQLHDRPKGTPSLARAAPAPDRAASPPLAAPAPGESLWRPMQLPRLSTPAETMVIVSADGTRLTSSAGQTFLDMTAGLSYANVGYGRREVLDAMVAQMGRLTTFPIFGDLAHNLAYELSDRLIEATAREQMRAVFFGGGGSDSVETAIKLARQYWKIVGSPSKTRLLSFDQAYHGMNFGALSVTHLGSLQEPYEPMLPGSITLPSLDPLTWPHDGDEDTFARVVAARIEETIRAVGAESIAALIAEPVQGAGGVFIPPRALWREMRRLCDTYDILLIADEVFTGFGRTGELFAVRHWDVVPDMMCLSKGLTSGYVPMGATLIGERIVRDWRAAGDTAWVLHGYTYSGHPLACAAALANLDVIVNEGLVERSRDLGEYLLRRLQSFSTHPRVKQVRGIGLMAAIDFQVDPAADGTPGNLGMYTAQMFTHLALKGVMVRRGAERLLITPPLVITREDIDLLVSALESALASNP